MSANPPDGFVRFAHGGAYDAGFGPTYVDYARGICAFRVAPHHANTSGVCHGGALATFLDAQILAAFGEARSEHMPTITLSVDYVAPLPIGSWVEAYVTLIRETRTMVFTQAVAIVDGDIVARSNAIYRNARKAAT